MKKLFYSAPFKFFLALFTSFVLLASVFGIAASAFLEFSDYSKEGYLLPRERRLRYNTESELYQIASIYLHDREALPASKGDFEYRIEDLQDTEIPSAQAPDFGFLHPQTIFVAKIYGDNGETGPFRFWTTEDFSWMYDPDLCKIYYRLTGSFTEQSDEIQAIQTQREIRNTLLTQKSNLFLLGIAALTITVGCGVFLCRLAGRKGSEKEIVLNLADRIPLDLMLGFLAAGIVGFGALAYAGTEEQTSRLTLGFLLCGAEILSLSLTWLLYTVAARIKGKALLKNTLVYRILHGLVRLGKKTFSTLWKFLQRIPAVPLTAGITGTLGAVNVIVAFACREEGLGLLFLLEWLVIFAAAVLIAYNFSLLQKKAKTLTEGNLTQKLNENQFIGPMKVHAETLNRIEDGLSTAVNERIKSERMKTELITNVSHDIKTPLTSIINYTDLLSKDESLSEKGKEYLSVLQRQSARLKKLTDDVVEVSKASSGTLSVEFAPCDLNVLLEQTVGEYQQRTEEKGLSVILTAPQTPVTISADGRRLWRIFDNLMNNVCKYALENTRVYLTLTQETGNAVITFRNISRDPLNVDSQELTERFVRGDQSRNTEGSGLGLAIARSLVELQRGTFRVDIDGDLFKVTLAFPLLTQE
ncbi:MAG: HAMP domain-containing histidine kinase [Clostridia bacterium]|nr:HAMP domain-containing histidine kinase [Clostridia bacterium]